MWTRLYRLLEHPTIYRLAGRILVIGGREGILQIIREILATHPAVDHILDVGCGPSSRLFPLGLRPVGADTSVTYMVEYARQGAAAVVASADALPFRSSSFDAVWSVGLLHHLSDEAAASAVRRMVQLCSSGGYVAILDAVRPRPAWRHPIAAIVRSLDRGRFMRHQEQIEALLLDRSGWSVERRIYSRNGMELLVCQYHKGVGEPVI